MTARAEYQRGMLDAVSDPSCHTVVIMSSAQIGKTEVVLNMLGYHIDQDPAPMLCVMPTIEMAQAFSKDRVRTMLNETPRLKNKVEDSGPRKAGSTQLHKLFPGGHLTLAGSNSPASLASRPVRFVLCDEVDRFPVTSGKEGDPVNLARKRSTTFWNRKTVLTSTPTDLEISRINMEFEASDKRHFWVPCQHCGEEQRLQWRNVKWPKGQPKKAKLVCHACGALWNEVDRQRAISKGQWIASKPENAGTAGFHLNELYSPWSTPAAMAAAFLKAKHEGTDSLKTFINTSLGEPWEPPAGETVDWSLLFKRREVYETPVPEGVQVLCGGIDVQSDRLEGEIIGYGSGEESWGIRYFRIYGDPSEPEIWDNLLEILKETYRGVDGSVWDVRMACIDSGGHYTDQVYEFSKRAGRMWVVPVKGSSEAGKPIANFPRKPNRQGVFLTMVGTDTAKEIIYARYQIAEPGPGYVHLPQSEEYDQEWAEQATAEEKRKKFKFGVPYYQWDARERRNEALDCRVYGFCALRILIQHMGVKLAETKKSYLKNTGKRPKVRKQTRAESQYL